MGRSDYPRTPQDTPGHPKIPQMHLISYVIHLFIHSDENKAKMASNSFHFQVHSFEKVLLNTAEKLIFFILYLFSYHYHRHHHHYYYFVDRQLNVVIPAVLGVSLYSLFNNL